MRCLVAWFGNIMTPDHFTQTSNHFALCLGANWANDDVCVFFLLWTVTQMLWAKDCNKCLRFAELLVGKRSLIFSQKVTDSRIDFSFVPSFTRIKNIKTRRWQLKHFLFSPLPGEIIQFWRAYFSDGLVTKNMRLSVWSDESKWRPFLP